MFACEILAALLDKGKAMQVVQSLLPVGAAPLLPLASKVILRIRGMRSTSQPEGQAVQTVRHRPGTAQVSCHADH